MCFFVLPVLSTLNYLLAECLFLGCNEREAKHITGGHICTVTIQLPRHPMDLKLVESDQINVKEKHPITNLNILLYQTNLDYRCNHQSIQVKLKQNSYF